MNTISLTCLITAAMAVAGCTNTMPRSSSDAVLKDSSNAVPGVILVQVHGFKKQEGQVSLALFDEAGYKGGAPVRGKNADVTGEVVTVKFEGLPAGDYGIKMYQDVDRNGKMNANAFGIPTEPYAFSNNAKGMMGPAKWDAAKFTVTEGGAVQRISVK